MLWKVLVLIFVAHASAAIAEVRYVAPEFVRAEADGSFSFQVLLVADEHSLGWAGYAYVGRQNVDAEIWVDTFCETLHEFVPGQPVTFEVSGRLVDRAEHGVIWSSSSFCEGGGGEQDTAILAPSVSNDDRSWTALKARFH